MWFSLAFEKPGSCPKPMGFGTCVELCSGDDSCPGFQKCCSNGCGHVCMNPGKYLILDKCTHEFRSVAVEILLCLQTAVYLQKA